MQANRPRLLIISFMLLVMLWAVITPTTTAQSDDAWQTYTKASVVNALAVENDFIWAATDGGVLRWDRTDGTYVKYTTTDGLAHNNVWDVAIDRTGRKWFATAFGLSVFDDQGWTTYTITNGLSNNDARAVAVDPAGNVWVGTWGGGVSVFNGQSWIYYTTADGLAGNYILTMDINEAGHKWFATANCRDGGCNGGGVSRFDGQSWMTYTTAEGLVSNWVEAIVTHPAGQTAWFGTRDGLSKFNGQTWDTTVRRGRVDALAFGSGGSGLGISAGRVSSILMAGAGFLTPRQMGHLTWGALLPSMTGGIYGWVQDIACLAVALASLTAKIGGR